MKPQTNNYCHLNFWLYIMFLEYTTEMEIYELN